MSGIAGIIHFDGKPIEPGLIEKMTSAMAHRGPDGIHHWGNGSVALGQCMLRTTPESLEEHQPLSNEDDSLVLVMDGRVDNREELRNDLLGRGAVLRNCSDAEMVLLAYEIWGSECPDRIIGEFVFFVWDARQRRLFGARDAAGVRHFYYSEGKGWFAFSSEIKGLLALGRIEPQLNEARLLDYLVVEFDRDDEVGTFYQGINRLPAGHAICVTEDSEKSWRYWNPGNLPAMIFSSLDECAEAFLEQLRIAVKCRLRSIGPVGAMLSGGLDSSSIVGVISKEFRSELKQPLETFSLVREDRENCFDWRSICEIIKDDWIKPTIISSAIPEDISHSYIREIRNFNEPFDFTLGFTESLIFKAAREKGCNVVLEGMAGDLLFYNSQKSLNIILRKKMFSRIPALLASNRRHNIDDSVRELALIMLRTITPKIIRKQYRKFRDKRLIKGIKLKETPGDLFQWLHHDTANQLLSMKRPEFNGYEESHVKIHLDQSAHARYFTTGLVSFPLEVTGRIAFYNGVEQRSPFSDRRLMEFAIKMPVETKLSVPWYKFLLRKSMADILPEDVRWRRDIGGGPGWKFYEKLIREISQTEPEIWNLEFIDSILNNWIDSSKLRRAWDKYDISPDYPNGFNILSLSILAKWINALPQPTKPI